MERKQVTFVSLVALLAGIACALGGSATAKSLDAPTITSVSPGTITPAPTEFSRNVATPTIT